MSGAGRVPASVVTGFLGAGKTTLVRHILAHAGGRRIAVIVNEFGSLGIDGDLLRDCGIPGCEPGDIVELANGCLCCTVADEFLPAMQALLDRADPPEHIVIETSGLALPKPLLKAFGWPGIRERVTVDGVISVVDAPAVLEGRFADDPAAVAAQRAADASLDHDNPLDEVFGDQLAAADLVVLNKVDLLPAGAEATIRAELAARLPRAVKIVGAAEGRIDPGVLLGLAAAAEDDLDARPSCHDDVGLAHEHDDFTSFSVALPELPALEPLLETVRRLSEAHDLLRVKGFLALAGRPMRLALQGVGTRLRHEFDRPFAPGEARAGALVVIGRDGLDEAAVAAGLRAAAGA